MQKDVSLKERLVFRRNALNLTQAELANKSGLSERSLSDYERGLSQPSLDQLRKLAKALDIPAAWLMGESHEYTQGSYRVAGVVHEIHEKSPSESLWSNLETETLMKSLAELANRFSKLTPHERKHVIGNMRHILDEVEARELAGKPVSSKATSDAENIASEVSDDLSRRKPHS